jgi:N-acetylglucosamine-6-phosphate deacetylase
MVGAAFVFPDAYCGIIADGHHVAWSNIQALVSAAGCTRVMLVTDAMSSAAGGPDSFALQGRTVTRVDGRLSLKDGTLAGSDLTMDVAVRNCVVHRISSLENALRMASRTPAEFLGRNDLGVMRAGALASLVHLDDKLNVLATWVEGQ